MYGRVMSMADVGDLLNLLDLLLGDPDPHGSHKHKCQCGCVWEHGNDKHGDEDAHHCPDCKELLGDGWCHYRGPLAPDYVEGPDGLPMAA